ncbi:hypothetical protein AVEN_81783-1 [Araneus ventricosus]|uniref:Uncharacterized protein n=1 Tax=Araneus ventricosus TaxID=182803 RepID=A0A4Y2JCB4_ARAVE|nr:hypothetical protein AVEN_81783-1 [Araneus ventricosus]
MKRRSNGTRTIGTMDTVISPLFRTTAEPATQAEVTEGTTQEERKWVIKLPTLRKPTRVQLCAVSFADHPCVGRQRPPVKSDNIQSTP